MLSIGLQSECQIVWIQIRPNIQTICKKWLQKLALDSTCRSTDDKLCFFTLKVMVSSMRMGKCTSTRMTPKFCSTTIFQEKRQRHSKMLDSTSPWSLILHQSFNREMFKWLNCRYGTTGLDNLNKKLQQKIVNIFLPIMFWFGCSNILGAQYTGFY